jgi:hypothetical protein
MRKIRPYEEVLLDLEIPLEEMTHNHKLQHGSILGDVYDWLKIHAPTNVEIYEDDGSQPTYYYGPKGVVIDEKGDIWPLKYYLKEKI